MAYAQIHRMTSSIVQIFAREETFEIEIEPKCTPARLFKKVSSKVSCGGSSPVKQAPHKHWEYQALEYLQVEPDAQVVGPV